MLGAMRKRNACHRAAVSWLLPLLMLDASPSSAQTLPVPPPLEQLQAECTRPQYASDTLVCGDAELRAADAQVAALASTSPTLAADAKWEDQASWLRRRSLCAFETDHRGCLIAAYADRRAVLAAIAHPATQPLRCTGAWHGRALSSSPISAGQALPINENGQVGAVATPPGTAWQPWVAWSESATGLKVQPLGASPFVCRLQSAPR